MQTTEKTLLSDLTVGEFREIVKDALGRLMPPVQETGSSFNPTGRLVYGLRGIQSLFNCSHKQAQLYKDSVIREAVKQNGRKIVVDVNHALELFNQRRAK